MTAYKSIEVEIKTKPLRKQEMKMQGMKDRLDESLGERRGKESSKMQSMKSRRNESEGADHHHKMASHHMKEHMKHMKMLHKMAKMAHKKV